MAADLRAVHPEHGAEIQAQAFLFTSPPAVAGDLPVESSPPFFSSLEEFIKELSDFCVARGDPPAQALLVCDRTFTPSEIFELFKAIAAEGGFEKISPAKWDSVCAAIGVDENLREPLQEAYVRHLRSFDKHVHEAPRRTRRKPPTLQQTRESQHTRTKTFSEKILAKRPEIERIVTRHLPGVSVEPFFALYSNMASTRSSLREGLRQAPRINQPFIPDTAPVRQTRSGNAPNTLPGTPSGQTPNSHYSGIDGSNMSGGQSNIDHFEGKDNKQVPMSTRDVATPGNKPDLFANSSSKDSKQPDVYDFYYPLTYLEVPRSTSIYKRVHFGLQSGLRDEVDFALYHLVQMSDQRGDKFRFEGFPLLMETLMEKALEITELCCGVKWELERDSYKWPEKRHRPNVLNTLWGTHDILDRISKLPVTLPDDTLETDEFCHHLQNIKDATLVLRNMCLLPENAIFISSFAKGLLRDFLVVMLNTPKQSRLNELRNDALDIAEEVTKYLPTAVDDPLRISLYRYINSDDRAHVVRAIWAITHFSTELEGVPNNAMLGVSHDHLVHLFSYTLLKPDPELLNGAMDFWYQFTLIPENVTRLIDVVNIKTVFIPRLIALLSYEAQLESNETVLQEEKIAPPPSTIPKVPPELLAELMELSEPERSSKWLRCCFVEDPDCEITQIALWQAYQTRFVNTQQPNSGVLPAAEFIKNVSTTFTNAQAQVVPIPGSVTGSGGPTTRFIIKGIRPLETALTFDKWPYLYCKWITGSGNQHCDRAFSKPEDLRSHVFEDHLNLQRTDQSGHYKPDQAREPINVCLWNNCRRIGRVGSSADSSKLIEHVASAHLPQPRDPNAQPPTHEREVLQPRIVRRWNYWNTPINSSGEPVGVAYKACLVLRNLAWNLPNEKSEKHGDMSFRKSVFLSRRNAIINAWDINRSLRLALTDLLLIIENFDD